MNRTCVPLSFALFALAFASLLPACDRTHLSEHFGEDSRRAFKQQVIDPKAGFVAKGDQALDPEEAAIISHTYLKSLTPPNQQSDQGGLQRDRLLIAPPLPPGGIGPGPAPQPGSTPR